MSNLILVLLNTICFVLDSFFFLLKFYFSISSLNILLIKIYLHDFFLFSLYWVILIWRFGSLVWKVNPNWLRIIFFSIDFFLIPLLNIGFVGNLDALFFYGIIPISCVDSRVNPSWFGPNIFFYLSIVVANFFLTILLINRAYRI
jgi:hypothetical protein